MMDWSGTSRKAKPNQLLSLAVETYAVPSAVPPQVRSFVEKRFRSFAFIRLLLRNV
jgi:hypothetical protein